jgi:hypothetical protein
MTLEVWKSTLAPSAGYSCIFYSGLPGRNINGLPFVCRVPLVDAKRYVAALRARKGAPAARIFVFNEDTHGLDRPQTEFEQWLNTIAFIKERLA